MRILITTTLLVATATALAGEHVHSAIRTRRDMSALASIERRRLQL
jgi:hypothetical protein